MHLVGEDKLFLSDCIHFFVSLKNKKFVEERRRYEVVNSNSRKADFLGRCGRMLVNNENPFKNCGHTFKG